MIFQSLQHTEQLLQETHMITLHVGFAQSLVIWPLCPLETFYECDTVQAHGSETRTEAAGLLGKLPGEFMQHLFLENIPFSETCTHAEPGENVCILRLQHGGGAKVARQHRLKWFPTQPVTLVGG